MVVDAARAWAGLPYLVMKPGPPAEVPVEAVVGLARPASIGTKCAAALRVLRSNALHRPAAGMMMGAASPSLGSSAAAEFRRPPAPVHSYSRMASWVERVDILEFVKVEP